ncbi:MULTISPECIES: SDR family NAD(P)-dependent oxidoreductase [unclassified Sphingobium]|nr:MULTISPECIES: glucose 1-dehydrogenase [unclassified Sphingobium]MBG6119978.1 NAD(P)-dependent dehydrogenase (short-subunit alcohol dehydrogenase family) [Sphingobium sp. JAI105]TWC99583.1 3-oxoacyl-[acyl-carrier protein] reductase [Sphingobium sp. AEW010]TWD18980.1 3-oxoacyl-[acyl-carrier protein] reductase [Sphingobium sp. AEW013]TWD21851.1 3-oxoacyl-[acyl-carrier protein] reductase [Sphingobium sp. AEW001]
MKLAGKSAIVTGAGSGQGRAVSVEFAREGASILLCDINLAGAEETAAMIADGGGKALPARCDISSGEDVRAAIALAVAQFGGIDILYNNAARNRPTDPIPERVGDMPEDHWLGTVAINLTGYYLFSKYALPHIIERRGVIINVASTLGLGGAENQGAYMATKAGEIALTKSMALDYGPQGVRVNAIAPGAIDTPRLTRVSTTYAATSAMDTLVERVPLQRIGTPDEIAKVALFLASDDSAYVSGACIPVDGGLAARR